MTRVAKVLLCGATALALCTGAKALTADNPYKSITERNVFGLKDPPPPPKPEDTNKPQPSKITLTGITTILGSARALMKTPPVGAAKPGEPPKTEQSYILTVGQRDGEIEVLEIDVAAGMVKVNNAGNVETLTFEKNGPKLPSGPPPAIAGVPGIPAPGQVASMPPPTGGPATATPFSLPSMRSIPTTTRSMRTQGTGQQGLPGYPGSNPGYGVPTAATGAQGTPGTTTLPGFGGSLNPQAPPPDPQINAEQAAVLMELERERLKSKNDPLWQMMPHTEITPDQYKQQQQQQNPNPTTPQNPTLPRPGAF